MIRNIHNFHIPVMGLAFTVDAPLKVAHYGIDSVISIVDDDLIEKMRGLHSRLNNIPYIPVSIKEPDYRAARITQYLNLINDLVKKNFASLKTGILDKGPELEKYYSLLPDGSELKQHLQDFIAGSLQAADMKDKLDRLMYCGSIDVNIMTKVDKINFDESGQLPVEFNDAHASLRGFAESSLSSSVVLSAGMNPRLYSYFEKFPDFFPRSDGELAKKIILKVSDFRSALIQGKFLARKGLWVSEFRIESGLNCGGHAFATDGYLIGPILEEFKNNRVFLITELYEVFADALIRKNIPFSKVPPELKITAQGGVGTSEENNFLLNYYRVDSVGWGTPFLLVPEVTNVDERTLDLLSRAEEDDLYLSNTSPLGVPFNCLRGNTKDLEKEEKANLGKPGSACPKKLLISDSEFSDKPICTASKKYQTQKIAQVNGSSLSDAVKSREYKKIVEKTCLCLGLAMPVLEMNKTAEKVDGVGTSVCPGPNMAYFSTIAALSEMVNHIYGRLNLIKRNDRPNMFMKELRLYLNYLEEKAAGIELPLSTNQVKYFTTFISNISDGIAYYKQLFAESAEKLFNIKVKPEYDLTRLEEKLEELISDMVEKNIIPGVYS